MTQVYVPDASNWINALEAGKRSGMADQAERTKREAGGLMAAGDYKGAAAKFYGGGQIAEGAAVANAGVQQEQQAQKLSRTAKVSEKLHAGDYAGAYAEAGTDKDLLDGLNAVSAHAKETTGILAASLQSLKGLDLPTARQKYQTEIAPSLKARGIFTPEQLQAFDPTPENIASMEGQVLGLEKSLDLAMKSDAAKETERHNRATEDGYVILPEGAKAIPKRPGAAEPAQPGAPAAPTGPTTDVAPPTGGIYATIGQIAGAKGAKPEEVPYLQKLALVESHGDPNAQNGSSTGIYQFHPDTFASVGGGNIHDVGDQTAAALALSRRDRANLQEIGIEPTDANVYIMHQQGPGGGRALLTAPADVGAVAVLTPIYGSAEIARKAIVGNGGTADMTAGEFTDMWRQRWANGGKPVASSAPATGTPAAERAGDPKGTLYGDPKPANEWVSLTPAESAQLGPGQYQRNAATGEVKQISGTAPKGSGAFKLSPQDSKYLSEARNTAQQLQNTVPLVDRFITLNKQVGSGGVMGVGLMTAGRALVDPKVAEMKSITDRLTPAMRQGMPGAASDRDVAMFQSATVGLAKPGPANQAVAGAIKAGARRQGDYVSFLEQYAKTNGSLLGAQEQWDAYAAANPLFDQDAGGALVVRRTTPWREYLDMPVTAAKAAAAGSPKQPAARPAALKADPAAVSAAKAAIAKGAPRAAVIQRLREHGIDPAGI